MKRDALINLRNNAGYTQKDTANRANITRSYYGLIENGVRNPGLQIAKRIADVYDVPLELAFPDEVFFAGKCYEMKQTE